MPCRHSSKPDRFLRRRRAGDGSVSLVGGGPGDPGLITTRGRQLLAQADVVVVDRLAPRALIDELDPEVDVVDVGKTPGNHPVTQDEINHLLIEHAAAGRVVRLKGGDPFVLGAAERKSWRARRPAFRSRSCPGSPVRWPFPRR